MTTHVNGTAAESTQSAEQIEADIARTRAELAHTVDELTGRFDVKARVQERVREVRDRATDDQGRPTPGTMAVGGAALAAVVAIVATVLWRRRR
ncbi:hypothetical protein GCM10023350_43570 [Nocardioides endophyticus]|uniref:DUF3618 domain-containing protein n=1 Tax=Nocardioides endophyticus TaxID=1353775 RepID=A0ABP8ZDL4_9ACTN